MIAPSNEHNNINKAVSIEAITSNYYVGLIP